MTLSVMPEPISYKPVGPVSKHSGFEPVNNIYETQVKKLVSPKKKVKKEVVTKNINNEYDRLLPVETLNPVKSVNNIDFNPALRSLPIDPRKNFEGDFALFLNEIVKKGTLSDQDKSSVFKSLSSNQEIRYISELVRKLLMTEVVMSVGFKKGMAALTGNPMWLIPIGPGEIPVMLAKALVVITQKGVSGKFMKMLAAMIPFVGGVTPLLGKSFNADKLLTKSISGYLGARSLRIERHDIIKQYKTDNTKELDASAKKRIKDRAISKLKQLKILEDGAIRAGEKKVQRIKDISKTVQDSVGFLLAPITKPINLTKKVFINQEAS